MVVGSSERRKQNINMPVGGWRWALVNLIWLLMYGDEWLPNRYSK